MLYRVKGDRIILTFVNKEPGEGSKLIKIPFQMENMSYLKVIGSTDDATILVVNGYSNNVNIEQDGVYIFNNGNSVLSFDISMSIEVVVGTNDETSVILDISKNI